MTGVLLSPPPPLSASLPPLLAPALGLRVAPAPPSTGTATPLPSPRSRFPTGISLCQPGSWLCLPRGPFLCLPWHRSRERIPLGASPKAPAPPHGYSPRPCPRRRRRSLLLGGRLTSAGPELPHTTFAEAESGKGGLRFSTAAAARAQGAPRCDPDREVCREGLAGTCSSVSAGGHDRTLQQHTATWKRLMSQSTRGSSLLDAEKGGENSKTVRGFTSHLQSGPNASWV